MIEIRPAHERGNTHLDWLNSHHSFSFGQYYDPKHMGVSNLRVINDDTMVPGGGFATHGHQNMEIVSYVLQGALAHKDSMGNGSIIRPNHVQRMSAGTGVQHSEYNASQTEAVHFLQIWLQPKGPDTARPFHPLDAPKLAYSLPEFGLTMPFKPTEFTQVNHGVNRMLVRRAVRMLAPGPGDKVADFFCGLGNFTLPIARRGAEVLGVEGSAGLVARALENARLNGLDGRTRYQVMNLFEMAPEILAALGRFDKWLVDPPRDGAVELVKSLPEDGSGPSRIVYVSCSPATLARDAAVLVHAKGYALKAAGVANMFPHTAHVESIALFEKNAPGRSEPGGGAAPPPAFRLTYRGTRPITAARRFRAWPQYGRNRSMVKKAPRRRKNGRCIRGPSFHREKMDARV